MVENDAEQQRSSSAVAHEAGDGGSERDSKESRWHVNRKLLPMKAHWFLFLGGLKSNRPFTSFAGTEPALVIYCTRVGMSSLEVGGLYAVLKVIQFLSKIIFGSFADKYQRHKTIFLGSLICKGFFLFSINYLPIPSNDGQSVTWTPPNGATIECLRRLSLPENNFSSAEEMRLTVCDPNAANQYFTVLSSATVACNVSCETSGFQDITTLFCAKNDLNCSSNHRYFFHAKPRAKQTVLSLQMSPEGHLQTGNSLCATLPITNVSFNPNGAATSKTSFKETQTTSSRCHLKETESDVRIDCDAVCVASVKPSEYAPAAANQDRTLQYVWIWVAYFIIWTAHGSVLSTSDTIVLHLLGGRHADFGKTRLFGSLGWGLMAPIVGFLIDKLSEDFPQKNYSPGFYVFGAFMLIDVLVNIPTEVNIPEKSEKLFEDVMHVFREPSVILMCFAVFVNGTTHGFLFIFLVVFTNKLSGGEQLIIGLNYAVECFLSEIPLFLVSGWLVSKLGHSHSMTISMLFCGMKSCLYYLVYDAWYILVIALLHGVTFGLFYTSMATYVDEISPPGTAATLQGIFHGIYAGIGAAVGNVVGGYAYQVLGAHETFLWFGLVTVGASVVHLVVALILKWIAPPPSQFSNSRVQLTSFANGASQVFSKPEQGTTL